MKPFVALLVLFAAQAESQELTSTLHTTFYGVQVAYTDEVVVFTCVLKGSNNLVWTSEQYIGASQQLSLVSAQPEGHEVRAVGNEQTVAVLLNATIDVIIVSELRIRVASTYPVASVQCVNGASTNEMNSTLFRLAGQASVDCDRRSVCSGETVTCTCATGNSNTLAWMFDSTRLEFTSNDLLLTRRNVSGTSTFAVLTENNDVTGIRVIMSNLTLSASSSDVILTCENVDQMMTEPIIVPITGNCPADQVTTPAENENTAASSSCGGIVAAAVIVPVIVLGALLIMTVVALIVLYLKYKPLQAQVDEKDDEIRDLKQQIVDKDGEIKQLSEEKEEEINTYREDIKEKNEQLKVKKQEIMNLNKSLSEQMGAKGKEVKNLQKVVKDRDATIQKLEGQINQNKKDLQTLKSQMDAQQKRVLKALEDKMRDDQKVALSALKATVKTEIEQALTKEMKKEILNELIKKLDTKMEEDIKKFLDTKQESWADVITSLFSKFYEALSNLSLKLTGR